MLFLVEVSPECEALAKKSNDLLQDLLLKAQAPGLSRKWTPSEDLNKEHFRNSDSLFVISQGAAKLTIEGNLFVLYEEGDILGLDLHRNISNAQISSDLPIQVDELTKGSFLAIVLRDNKLSELWVEYLNLQAQLYLQLSASLLKNTAVFQPEVQNIEAGQVIIKQGSFGNEVFTMIEGAADVMVDGVKVGEVRENQIFGALAAFTNTARSASVIATAPCTIVSLKEGQFVELMKTRPETVFSLCRDMANTIVDLNKKVVGLEKRASAKL